MTLQPTAPDSALNWIKSSYVRDSKNADGPRLAFSPRAWAQFVSCAAPRRASGA